MIRTFRGFPEAHGPNKAAMAGATLLHGVAALVIVLAIRILAVPEMAKTVPPRWVFPLLPHHAAPAGGGSSRSRPDVGRRVAGIVRPASADPPPRVLPPSPPSQPAIAESPAGTPGPPGAADPGNGPGSDEGSGPDGRGPGDVPGEGPGMRIPGDARDDEPIPITSRVVPPLLLSKVEPDYPRLARISRVHGVVVLDCIIDRQGTVAVRSVRRSVSLLDDAAVAAVSQWRYQPATVEGRPQAVFLTVRVEFSL